MLYGIQCLAALLQGYYLGLGCLGKRRSPHSIKAISHIARNFTGRRHDPVNVGILPSSKLTPTFDVHLGNPNKGAIRLSREIRARTTVGELAEFRKGRHDR